MISSEHFGVPQKRKRYIIIGFSKSYFKSQKISLNEIFERIMSDSIEFTKKYHYDDTHIDITNTTIGEALSDLDGENLNTITYQDENAISKNQ